MRTLKKRGGSDKAFNLIRFHIRQMEAALKHPTNQIYFLVTNAMFLRQEYDLNWLGKHRSSEYRDTYMSLIKKLDDLIEAILEANDKPLAMKRSQSSDTGRAVQTPVEPAKVIDLTSSGSPERQTQSVVDMTVEEEDDDDDVDKMMAALFGKQKPGRRKGKQTTGRRKK